MSAHRATNQKSAKCSTCGAPVVLGSRTRTPYHRPPHVTVPDHAATVDAHRGHSDGEADHVCNLSCLVRATVEAES